MSVPDRFAIDDPAFEPVEITVSDKILLQQFDQSQLIVMSRDGALQLALGLLARLEHKDGRS